MKTRLVYMCMLLALLSGLLTMGTKTRTASAQNKGISPANVLNGDGTLRADGNFSGSLDLTGWHVDMDPQRGPVLGPAQSNDSARSPASARPWSNLGNGLQALNGSVSAIAVSGTDINIGGNLMMQAVFLPRIPLSNGMAVPGRHQAATAREMASSMALYGREPSAA